MKRLDQKLSRIRKGQYTAKDFIIADAKDADMAFGVTAPGPNRSAGLGKRSFKTLADYRAQIREVISQGLVDIMLLSASNLEQLAIKEKLFENSHITPAARANDTTDVWVARASNYTQQPSRPFRTATLDHIMYGKIPSYRPQKHLGADLGLYSVTSTNDLDHDYAALQAFSEFRLEAEKKKFRYFLEIFNPNVDTGFDPKETGSFVNDNIIRCLAGVPEAGRPVFLKIPYNGPAALDELVSYDDKLVVGILGGSAGTTRDAFQLIHDAQKYGAKVALFGRKINLSEHPLAFIKMLRAITDGDITPEEAVRAYHGAMQSAGITPERSLDVDQRLTEGSLSYG